MNREAKELVALARELMSKYPESAPTEPERKKWREEAEKRRRKEGIRPRKADYGEEASAELEKYLEKAGRSAASITAATVKEGDICTVDMWKDQEATDDILGMQKPQLKILKDVVLQGGGKVLVESVRGSTAHVTAYGNPVSRMVGGVDVPVSILKVVGHTASRTVHLEPKNMGANQK